MEREIIALSRAARVAGRAVRGRHRRRQGLGQAAGPRAPHGPRRHLRHRRRHGQHVPRGQGLHRGQEPARTRPRRGRGPHPGAGRGEGRDLPAADRRGRGQGGHPRRRAQDRAGHKIPNSWSAVDVGPPAWSPSRRPWPTRRRSSGTARWASSRCRPSATARAPWRASWPTRPTRARRSWSAAATRWPLSRSSA